METKQLVGGVVGLAVAVILVATLLVPIIDSSAESTIDVTYSNKDHIYKAELLDTTADLTLTFSTPSDNTAVWTATNGEFVQDLTTVETTLLTLDGKDILRTGYRYGSINHAVLQIISSSEDSYAVTSASVFGATVTLSEGTATIEASFIGGGTTTYTYTYTEYAIVPGNGSYIMSAGAEDYFLKEDSNIYANGLTSVGATSSALVKISGTVANPIVTALPNSSGATVSVSNVQSNYTPYGTDGVLWDSITFDLTIGEDTTAATYNRLFIPESTTISEKAMDDTTVNLLQVIPVLVLVGLVVGVVGMFIRTRAD